MKKAFFVALMALTLLLHTASANAHVFFTDESGKSGVIMHILPDDDPIAGNITQMFFSIQDTNLSTQTHSYSVYIIDDRTPEFQTQALAYKMGDQSVSASYNFPSQGGYTIELVAVPLYDATKPADPPERIVFPYSLRVSRGISYSPLDQPRYTWAEFGFIASLCAIVVLLIVVVNRWARIVRFTKW